ncbi:hypothetical protein [Dyadobacter pollutisoli]|jgi:hypothetical protein|uniref:Uncharacterized protein n=1 Tax=Dyadobacter pollutisoli TaxID=2910158 RepID=A0A9E8NHP2_9BACT|nr:hypothetical protein [Dyadobacter pollutisoli]WAC15202.1 hypothetical protein ON006_14785 [Dyadobacter pollutisoli]
MKHVTFTFFVLLSSIFLAAVSCQDHEIAPQPPTLKTIEFQSISSPRTIIFKLELTNSDGVPIKEYGILMQPLNLPLPVIDPLYGDSGVTKILFDNPASAGLNSKQVPNPEIPVSFYRAFAVLESGAIVYGNTISDVNQ